MGKTETTTKNPDVRNPEFLKLTESNQNVNRINSTQPQTVRRLPGFYLLTEITDGYRLPPHEYSHLLILDANSQGESRIPRMSDRTSDRFRLGFGLGLGLGLLISRLFRIGGL